GLPRLRSRDAGATPMKAGSLNEANLKLLGLLALSATLLCAPVARAEPNPSPDDARFFETTIRPILQANCVKCHGGEKTRGGLKLLSRASILAGGRNVHVAR